MKNLLRLSLLIGSFLLLWQSLIIFLKLPPYLLPSPLEVATSFYSHRLLIAQHTIPTLIETLGGFSLGILSGCMAGCLVSSFKPLRFWFLPLLIISQAIPTFAIAPLLVLWLGYGLTSKIMTAVLIIFFPICSALYDGLRNVPHAWLDLAKTMQANQWRRFVHISFPAALPALASGLRIAAVGAPIGAIVGEWVGSSRGLGYLMLNANARLQIDLMFAALVVIVILALSLYLIVDKCLERLITW